MVEVKVGAEEGAEESYSAAQWLPARVQGDFNHAENAYKVCANARRGGEGASTRARSGGLVVTHTLPLSASGVCPSWVRQVCMLVGYDGGDATFDVEAACVRAIEQQAGAGVNPRKVDGGLQCKAWNPLEGWAKPSPLSSLHNLIPFHQGRRRPELTRLLLMRVCASVDVRVLVSRQKGIFTTARWRV